MTTPNNPEQAFDPVLSDDDIRAAIERNPGAEYELVPFARVIEREAVMAKRKRRDAAVTAQLAALEGHLYEALLGQSRAAGSVGAFRKIWEERCQEFADRIATLERQRGELVEALKGVVRVADRDTDEFNAARAALAAAQEGSSHG